MQNKQPYTFQKIFCQPLMESDLVQDLYALIELIKEKSSLDNLSDLVIVLPKGSEKTGKKLEEAFQKQKQTISIIPLTAQTKKEITYKRFAFVILPKHFINLKLKSILSKIDDKESKYTNIILITSKLTKKVKKYPFFTSHFNNIKFTSRI